MDMKLILAILGVAQFIALQISVFSKVGSDIRSLNFAGAFSDIFGMTSGGSMAVFAISGAIGLFSFLYLGMRMVRYLKH